MSEQIRAFFDLANDAIGIYLRVDGAHVAKVEADPAWTRGLIVPPTMRLEQRDAQQLADDLWAAGLRPSQGRQSEGIVTAQAAHLEDMRSLAFAKLGVTKP